MNQEELRLAIVRRDFNQVQSLIGEWGRTVAVKMNSTSNPEELGRIYASSKQFGEEAIYLVQVVRAHIAAELQANSASFLYQDADLEQRNWQVNA